MKKTTKNDEWMVDLVPKQWYLLNKQKRYLLKVGTIPGQIVLVQ